ncbi:MarR family winged helix-turn-helix transcriptional regulator [Homoserinibacter sp. YIM 151385]|uniref:MarR family winged helix-turn-helix transcriptional regulator n=1 Tax=Homoserinibacter sp. YIM 151385 TaxID=2985506 RepID=UPI0022F0742C|nr:MarR family transcriptional regulator [Homoserinibacter sp. YIM 151385]WBU38796.1 MarR family transcriptional regulator [Homoserinibacter sp. YIM 151385]
MAEDFGQRLPYLLRRVNGALSQRLDEDLREFRLTPSQLSALAILDVAHPDGLSGATLSARSGVTPQSMSTALAGLAERGLIARSPHPVHGRIMECRITAAGADILRQVQQTTRDSDRYDAGLTPEQQETLRELLTTMMRSLDLYLPAETTATRDEEEPARSHVAPGDVRAIALRQPDTCSARPG